jgi:caffeoyl-CoA O-methyltransferase
MYLSEDAARFVRATGPDHDEIQAEMAAYADEHGFPIIGPDAGGVLQFLASVTGARRVFEFGSGFGYSASWFLRGMPADGEVVLTEVDADELAMAEEYLGRAGVADRAVFEEGDAFDAVERHDGPFDLILIDHQKTRYAAAFETIQDELAEGGVVVADNMMRGAVRFEDLLPYVEDGDGVPADANTRGVVEYLDAVRGSAFRTTLLPIGKGLALTTPARDS